MFARRAAALLLAAVLLVGAIPAAFAEEEGTPEGEAVHSKPISLAFEKYSNT